MPKQQADPDIERMYSAQLAFAKALKRRYSLYSTGGFVALGAGVFAGLETGWPYFLMLAVIPLLYLFYQLEKRRYLTALRALRDQALERANISEPDSNAAHAYLKQQRALCDLQDMTGTEADPNRWIRL